MHTVFMNRLSNEKREQIVRAMVEGNSVRSITRMTGVCQEAILKLLYDLGAACAKLHDRKVRAVRSKRIQCDEIWSFVGAKQKNASPEQKAEDCGDVWTWTAIDADTKLCISYFVGGRGQGWAKDFVWEIRLRVVGHAPN